ncbi:PAS domain S-box protein [Aerosakkonemataceae cyanobacterium BLCC-F50]|uniref:histidine kinase n=1 Tax=Floridaenema flaviceps BLCC-F50 TaxID=3153642 RepID=A0ABV4Y096_9CYAN
MFTHIDALWLELKSAVVRNPLVVSPELTAIDAIHLMAGEAIAPTSSIRFQYEEDLAQTVDEQLDKLHLQVRSSCVVVVEDEQVVGILTERDIVFLSVQQQDLDRLTVRQVMTHPVSTLREEALTEPKLVMNLLQQQHVGYLPILDEQDRLVGIVTQNSLLQALNPLKLYKLAEVLETKVVSLEAEKVALLESPTIELEQEVEVRTPALQTKAEREKLVAQIANRIRNSLNLQEILDVCVAEVRAFLACDRVLVYQFQPDWSGIIIAESVNSGWSSTLGNQIQDSYFGQQIATLYDNERPIIVNNIYTAGYADCHIELLEKYQIKANLVVPIRVTGQLWGLLIGNQCAGYRDWQEEDITLLQHISVQLAIAIQQATTHQRLQQELNERRLAEQQLRESEQRYASLAEAALVGIFRADAAGNCIYGNNRYFEITGFTRETAFGKGWEKALHPDDLDRVMAECYQSVEENRPFQLEYRFQCPDGTVTWVYGQSVPERDANGQIIGHVGTITDITDRKRAETALKKTEQQSRVAQRIAHLGHWEMDLVKGTSYWSDEIFRIFEIEPQTFSPSYEGFLNFVHPDDREMLNEAYTLHLRDRTPYKIVHRLPLPDGRIKYLQEQCETLYAEDGTPLLSQGTVQDITSIKLAQLELERLNADLEAKIAERTQELWQVNNLQRAILDSTNYAIISTDVTGIIQTFNVGAQRMLGYNASEVVGKLTPSIIHDSEETLQRAAELSVEMGRNISPGFEVFVAKARQGIVSEQEWTYQKKWV